MAFPADPLPIRAEMLIDGTWVDVTDRVRGEGNITITGGFAPEQATLSPCDIAFMLNNRDGLFSDDNPLSSYYGLLPTCTPFRAAIEESETFIVLPLYLSQDPTAYTDWQAGFVSTGDKAVLDVTGDLDLRIEVEPHTWTLGLAGQTLAGKYDNTTGNRSWFWMLLPSGRMRFYWSIDGNDPTGGTTFADSTEAVARGARIALRVTIDVNNGAAGRTVTFYTADTIAGSWTQLGDPVVQSGTTSIFSSTADLQVGAVRNAALAYPITSGFNSATVPPSLPMAGRLYAFEMRNGIAGTLVADLDAAAQAEGVTSWSDGLGTPNTWTLANSAEITRADYRGYGEIAEMPQEWDGTGANVYVPVTASGISRRLTQGASPLRSPIYRNLSQFIGAGALGYWPGEDGARGTTLSNAVPGQPIGALTGSVSFVPDDDMPGSDGVFTLDEDTASVSGRVTGAADTGYAFALFYVKLPAAPAASIDVLDLYVSGGTVGRLTFTTSATTYGMNVYDTAGVSLGSANGAYGADDAPGRWLAFQVRMTDTGSDVELNLAWFVVGTTSFVGLSPTTITGSSFGKVTGFATKGGAAVARASFAHIMVGNIDFEYVGTDFAPSSNAWSGETAGRRYLRVCEEEGIRARLIGWPADTEPMGPQPLATAVAILDECVTVDDGLQFEARDQPALVMRTRRSLNAQAATELSYAADHLSGSFRPTLDDRALRNDIAVSRPAGGQARATKETGPRSIAAVGRYDTAPSLNASEDERLSALAHHALLVGTWPDRRVPNVEAWLQRGAYVADVALTRSVRALNPGDRLLVSDVPIWVGGGDADTIVRGYQETLKNRGHELAFSTAPYGPYGAVNDLTLSAVSRYRAAATGTVLATGITDSATSLTAYTPEGKLWRRSSGAPSGTFPMDVVLGGERVTVSALSDVTLSFVAAGAVAHADYAGISPGLPAGLAAGDFMVLLVAVRNTSALVGTPSGWLRLTEPGSGGPNAALFGRIAQSSGNTPSVTFSGGAAGDTVSAQVAAFRPSASLYASADVRDMVVDARWQANASAQDIACPALTVDRVALDNSLILYLGWKQDDWTSVAGPGTEVGEPSSTLGSDQGITWAYVIQTTATAIAETSFTVTGGASAVSKGAVVVVNARHQVMSSLTRNAGGLPAGKAQAAGDDIQVAEPFYAAL